MAKVKWVLEYTEMFLDLFSFRQNKTHHAKSTDGLQFSNMNLNHWMQYPLEQFLGYGQAAECAPVQGSWAHWLQREYRDRGPWAWPKYIASLLLTATLSSFFRGTLRYSHASWVTESQQWFLVLPWGFLPWWTYPEDLGADVSLSGTSSVSSTLSLWLRPLIGQRWSTIRQHGHNWSLPDLALSTGEGVQGDKIPGAW